MLPTRLLLSVNCFDSEIMLSSNRTTINLEKVLAQTVDCEYKTTAKSTVIVLRPWWGAWSIGLALAGMIAIAFIQTPTMAVATAVLSASMLGFGVWTLLTQRQYQIRHGAADSQRSRKLIIGLDDPVYCELVTIDCELEEDYTIADAFEFVQGMRTVCRRLSGDATIDSGELVDTGELLVGDTRANAADGGTAKAKADQGLRQHH